MAIDPKFVEKTVLNQFISALKTKFTNHPTYPLNTRLKLVSEEFPEKERKLPALIVSCGPFEYNSDWLDDYIGTGEETVDIFDEEGHKIGEKDIVFDLWGFIASGDVNVDCLTQDNVSCRELTQEVLNSFLVLNSNMVFRGSTDILSTLRDTLDDNNIWVTDRTVQGERQEAITPDEYLWINTVRLSFEYEIFFRKKDDGMYELYKIIPTLKEKFT